MSLLPAEAITPVPTGKPLVGEIALPGSKSITNRALLLAGLAKGKTRLTGALSSDDTQYMAEALRQMGVQVTQLSDTSFEVVSTGQLQQPEKPLFIGNAGTAMRFLTAIGALVEGKTVFDGNEHMRKRPIKPLVEALARLGVDGTSTGDCPPVTVHGTGRLPKQKVVIDASLSSQYISALLMMAAGNDQPVEVALDREDIDARGYIDITLAVMKAFGAGVNENRPGSWIVEATGYQAADYRVEPDASAATYLWAAEKLTGGRIDIGCDPRELSQPDAKAYDVIQSFPDMPAEIDGSQMQDAVPTLAVLAAFNNNPVRFTNIGNLRVKECDRLAAVATELSKIRDGLGVEDGDALIVNADPALAGQTLPADIHTYADHRIAMSFALAGLKIGGVRITDPGCVSKTYPRYWDDMATLGVQFSVEQQKNSAS